MPVVTLRAPVPADEPFLREVYRSGRADEFAPARLEPSHLRAILDSQYDLQAASYARHFPEAQTFVICCDGAAAGRLIKGPAGDALGLLDIALLPEFRNRGVGTHVVRDLQEEARAAGVGLTLYVDRTNPALRLYQRLGFEETRADEMRHLLRWKPDS